MPNRTISLCNISDEIRKELVKSQNFSHWIRKRLIEWSGQEHEVIEPKVPYHYPCQRCGRTGVHWTKNCNTKLGNEE